MENKKYVLTEEIFEIDGITLYRIKSISNFSDVKIGDLGGFVESEHNLSVYGEAWVYGNAKVYGEAQVYGNAKVCDEAEVCGNARVCGEAWVYDKAEVYGNAKVCDEAEVCGEAKVCGNARVCGEAKVCGNVRVYGEAWVYGNAQVYGNAKVCGNADYILFKNWWSSGRFFTWTKSNNMWKVGCFYGTGEELIKKAYQDSGISGREYERIVQYVNSILADENK